MRLKSTGLTCIDFKKGNHESQLGHKALTVNNDMCDFFHETICITSLGCWTLGKTSENTVICHESPYIQRQKHPIATALPLLGPYWTSPERRLARWRASQTVAYLIGALIGYSRVPNKRPGRLLFLSLYAFGTVIISGTLIFFYPF